ncbi:hypothetical protein ACLOJK_014706, partial [Asimina triloba]
VHHRNTEIRCSIFPRAALDPPLASGKPTDPCRASSSSCQADFRSADQHPSRPRSPAAGGSAPIPSRPFSDSHFENGNLAALGDGSKQRSSPTIQASRSQQSPSPASPPIVARNPSSTQLQIPKSSIDGSGSSTHLKLDSITIQHHPRQLDPSRAVADFNDRPAITVRQQASDQAPSSAKIFTGQRPIRQITNQHRVIRRHSSKPSIPMALDPSRVAPIPNPSEAARDPAPHDSFFPTSIQSDDSRNFGQHKAISTVQEQSSFWRRCRAIRPNNSRQFKERKADLEATSTMDANNYQWGYQSVYEEDAISVATAQLAAWKERLEMNGICSTYGAAHSTERCPFINEDFLQQNTWSTDPPDFSQPMQLSENEPSLKDLMLYRQPESFPSNTEPNPRQNDRAQCPSVTLRIEVQPEPKSQNADELVSSSSSPNSSSSKPTPPSPFKQCISPPCKQTSFNEEKASQVDIEHSQADDYKSELLLLRRDRYTTGAPKFGAPSSPWSRPRPTAGEWKTGRSMPSIFFILPGRFQICRLASIPSKESSSGRLRTDPITSLLRQPLQKWKPGSLGRWQQAAIVTNDRSKPFTAISTAHITTDRSQEPIFYTTANPQIVDRRFRQLDPPRAGQHHDPAPSQAGPHQPNPSTSSSSTHLERWQTSTIGQRSRSGNRPAIKRRLQPRSSRASDPLGRSRTNTIRAPSDDTPPSHPFLWRSIQAGWAPFRTHSRQQETQLRTTASFQHTSNPMTAEIPAS